MGHVADAVIGVVDLPVGACGVGKAVKVVVAVGLAEIVFRCASRTVVGDGNDVAALIERVT